MPSIAKRDRRPAWQNAPPRLRQSHVRYPFPLSDEPLHEERSNTVWAAVALFVAVGVVLAANWIWGPVQ